MLKRRGLIGIVLGVLVMPAAIAQQSGCPALGSNSGLHWDVTRADDLLFCRALTEAQDEVFSVSISSDSPFNPVRRNRGEKAVINGQEVYWYRTEIATRPDLQARETSIALDNGRVAYFNVQSASEDGLRLAFERIAQLGF